MAAANKQEEAVRNDPAASSDGEDAQAPTDGDVATVPVRNRPRRKATEKPEGADAVRQSFSKRKKGLAAKAYQLNALTGAKVAVFVVNEKGSSWAYSTPGFGAAVSPQYLALMRKLAGLPSSPKLSTDVMVHPSDDHATDDRDHWKTTTHPALTEPPNVGAGQPLYKLQPHSSMGPGMVAMLHPTFTSTPAGQAVGHPTGHISFVQPPHSGAEEVAAATSPQPRGFVSVAFPPSPPADAANPSAPQNTVSTGVVTTASPAAPQQSAAAATTRSKATKRTAEAAALPAQDTESQQARAEPAEEPVPEKPPMLLTRQAAILPAEAPPPEGILPRRTRRAPGPSQ